MEILYFISGILLLIIVVLIISYYYECRMYKRLVKALKEAIQLRDNLIEQQNELNTLMVNFIKKQS